MDLSTLSTLLEQHTATLTQLYESLGAPDDTVPNKLQELHEALISTVTKQREDAEKEVKDIRTKVDDLRHSLKRSRRRLGEARVSTGGEGETLLQALKRLELEVPVTDKLLAAREKQFAAVRERLAVFAEVLKDDDTLLPADDTAAKGDQDLSLARLKELEARATRCQTEITTREQTLRALVQEIAALWSELGEQPGTAKGSSEPEEGPSTASQDADLDAQILVMLDQETTGATSTPGSSLSATKSTLTALQERKQSLEELRETRMQEIQTLYDELYLLWNKLGVSDEEADEFVEMWQGTEQRCIDAYRAELARMLQVKADNMAVFIAKEKEDIAALWDALFYSDEYRSMQGLLQSNEATEEVLEAHEQERLRLTQEIADKQPILVRLAKYFALLEEMQQLEASANDPSRLLGKAQRGDPGRLLREEKSRKRVAVQKPKLEQDLLTAIPAWEEQYQQPFLVNGTRFVEDLQARIEAEEAAKPPSKRAKAGSSTLSSAARLNNTDASAAGSKRQVPGSSSVSRPSSAMSTSMPSTMKRARTTTQSTGGRYGQPSAGIQRPMHTGSSIASSSHQIPATPCPTSFINSNATMTNYMLAPSTGQSMALRPPLSGTSRLPLAGHHSTLPQKTNWQQLGHGRATSSNPKSLFSPPARIPTMNENANPHRPSRQSFRPRPSLASVSTATSSMASMSSWGMRTASSATSVASEGPC